MVILDDQLNGVWNKEPPSCLQHDSTGLLWVTPWRFDLNKNDEDPMFVDATVGDRIEAKRDRDDMFWRFMKMLRETAIPPGESMTAIIPEIAWPARNL